MKTKRWIRLKEWKRSSEEIFWPDDGYLKLTDGSLAAGEFVLPIDENGFMSSPKPAGEDDKNVIFLGDSIVESLYIDVDERLYRVAERALNYRSLDLRFLGGGVSGATSLHTLHVMTSKIIPMKPQLTVLLNGFMDVSCATEADSFWSTHVHLDPFVYQDQKPIIDTQKKSANFEDRKRILRTMCFMFKEFRLPLAFATFHRRVWEPQKDPFLAQSGDETAFHANECLWDQANQVTRDVAREFKIPLFDVERRFRGRSDLLYDTHHLNTSGNAEVGAWLGWQIADLLLASKQTSSKRLLRYLRSIYRK